MCSGLQLLDKSSVASLSVLAKSNGRDLIVTMETVSSQFEVIRVRLVASFFQMCYCIFVQHELISFIITLLGII